MLPVCNSPAASCSYTLTCFLAISTVSSGEEDQQDSVSTFNHDTPISQAVIPASALLIVHLPSIAAVLGHQLQVLDAHSLVLQLRHGVVNAFLPRRDVVLLPGGGSRQFVSETQRRSDPARSSAPHSSPANPSPLHAEQLQGLPGRQALELVPHDLGLRGEGGEGRAGGRREGTGRGGSPRRRCSRVPAGS